jgi:hypothetical protein
MVCDVEYQKRLGNDSSLPPYRPGLYYDWVSDPPLEPWNLTAFCRNLHGKKILIVGDSLNHQLYESMVNHGTSTPPADQWEGSVKSKERVLCGGTPYKVAVSFQRNVGAYTVVPGSFRAQLRFMGLQHPSFPCGSSGLFRMMDCECPAQKQSLQ